MQRILPFNVGDLSLVDERGPMDDALREDSVLVYMKQWEERLDERLQATGVEPGCATMRDKTLWPLYIATTSDEIGTKAGWDAFQEARRLERESPEKFGSGKDDFALYGFRDGRPVGGLQLFGVKINRRGGNNLHVTAYVAPMLVDPEDVSRLMGHMLRNQLPAIDKRGDPIFVIFDEWNFPRTERRNRWYKSTLRTQLETSDLDDFDVDYEAADNDIYPVRARLRRPPGVGP